MSYFLTVLPSFKGDDDQSVVEFFQTFELICDAAKYTPHRRANLLRMKIPANSPADQTIAACTPQNVAIDNTWYNTVKRHLINEYYGEDKIREDANLIFEQELMIQGDIDYRTFETSFRATLNKSNKARLNLNQLVIPDADVVKLYLKYLNPFIKEELRKKLDKRLDMYNLNTLSKLAKKVCSDADETARETSVPAALAIPHRRISQPRPRTGGIPTATPLHVPRPKKYANVTFGGYETRHYSIDKNKQHNRNNLNKHDPTFNTTDIKELLDDVLTTVRTTSEHMAKTQRDIKIQVDINQTRLERVIQNMTNMAQTQNSSATHPQLTMTPQVQQNYQDNERGHLSGHKRKPLEQLQR